MVNKQPNKTTPLLSSDKTGAIKITETKALIQREPLSQPFGFKGGNLTALWQVIVQVKSANGHSAIGLGVQSVLWSDPVIFNAHTEEQGNKLMFRVTQEALQLLQNDEYTNPVTLLDALFDQVYAYAKKITNNDRLRKTFVLNALTPVDNALWLLYAHENGIRDFDTMIPPAYRDSLSAKNDKLAAIPVISYGMQEPAIKNLMDEGYFFLKIKIGHAGASKEMLEKDKAWISFIHNIAGKVRTPYTPDGRIRYYLDANGRYLEKDQLKLFIDHLDKIGATDQVALLEEPFPENTEIDVSDLNVRMAMDESAHADTEVISGIQMGYKAIALKPVAKTLSMTLKILKIASAYQVPCFCADLTASPVLVEWNKNIAARLSPFPGIAFNLLETNGSQNYKNWSKLCLTNPCHDFPWTEIKNGIFKLNKEFYEKSACIFTPLAYYQQLFNH
jgi:L-alanine-DL-glutamate epimerase-like enolase superfamily enzyme